MLYPLLIILVVALHYLFVATAVFGAAVVLRWPKFAWVQIPVMAWAALIVLDPWTCPLTSLENTLRIRAGWNTYTGGFLVHYVHPAINALGLHAMVPYLGYFVIAVNAGLYSVLLLQSKRGRANSQPRPDSAID